jgi:hypothetical protein
MLQAAAYVYTHPGCTKHEASLAVGPHGSNAFGWRSVNRAIAAELIEDRAPGSWTYRLYATAAGEALVDRERGKL